MLYVSKHSVCRRQVETPAEVNRLLDTILIGVSFGVSSTSSVLECLRLGGYRSELILYLTTPFIITATIVIFAACGVLTKKIQHAKRLPSSQAIAAEPARAPSVLAQAAHQSALNAAAGLNETLETATPLVLKLAFLAYV